MSLDLTFSGICESLLPNVCVPLLDDSGEGNGLVDASILDDEFSRVSPLEDLVPRLEVYELKAGTILARQDTRLFSQKIVPRSSLGLSSVLSLDPFLAIVEPSGSVLLRFQLKHFHLEAFFDQYNNVTIKCEFGAQNEDGKTGSFTVNLALPTDGGGNILLERHLRMVNVKVMTVKSTFSTSEKAGAAQRDTGTRKAKVVAVGRLTEAKNSAKKSNSSTQTEKGNENEQIAIDIFNAFSYPGRFTFRKALLNHLGKKTEMNLKLHKSLADEVDRLLVERRQEIEKYKKVFKKTDMFKQMMASRQ